MRVKIEIYDEDTGDVQMATDEPLFDNEEEISIQAFRTQRSYHQRLEAEAIHLEDL
jgi:hypothetical protein